MNGAVIPNTPIAVDFWRVRRCPHSRIFFLSHMHADHTAGLTSSWHSYTIYCSEVTKKLVKAKLRVKSELVVGLPLDEPVTINLDEVGQETMTVTLLDANHCPGSVMFSFEGYFGKILYTGDFRFCQGFLAHSAIKGKQFDILYLDNTYCHPKCFFPTRACATITMMEIIRNHPEHKIVIGLHSLGKEVLLHNISIACKTWIGVDPLRRQTLELLGMPHVFTCDVDNARIRVVNAKEVNKRNIELWNIREPTIAILPTCLFVGGSNPYENLPNVFVVPYSDHSSFEELKKFVQSIRPRKIVPIVQKHRLSQDETIYSRVNMNIFQHLMDSSPSPQYTIPHSVECFMAAEIRQDTKKRAKATRQLCMKKVVKTKKPCGIVFPPSLETTEEEEKNCGLVSGDLLEKLENGSEIGDVNHGLVKEINNDSRRAVAPPSSIKQGSHSGEKVSGNVGKNKDIDIMEKASDRETAVVSSIKQVIDSGEKVEDHHDGDRYDVDMADETINEGSAVASSFIEQDGASGGKEVEDDGDGKDVDMANETIDEGSAVSSSSIKQESDSGRKEKEDGGDDQDVDMAEETDNEESKVASLKQDGDSGENVKVDSFGNDHNLDMAEETSDEEIFTLASCIETNVTYHKSAVTPKGNLVITTTNVGELCDPKDDSLLSAAEQQASKKKKFNIYTGCTCDFARKVLEDLIKNGAI